MDKVIVTSGAPEGISPEITIKALNAVNPPADKIILISNSSILDLYRKKYGVYLKKEYEIIDIPFDISKMEIGEETKEGGEFSFRALETACRLAKSGKASAIVTAPVSKNAMKLAGHNFSGQTEILEKYLAHDGQKAEMVFICSNFAVMLMTRHIQLNKVSEYIKKEFIIERVKKLNLSFEKQLNIKNPSFRICALNPHAGENGMFGREEINEIIPAVKELQKQGINIEGPFPADALFAGLSRMKPKYECYIAMYHDQGLIPVKLLEKNCVNASLGLDILRTSPAHGTAYDIAGKNQADASSMINALKSALNFLI